MPIIVEGKYDKITLENLVDTLIITTDGFGIFKNKEKRILIKKLAQKNGIVILTDSDSAGAVIRAHLKNIVADGKIINVYIPCLKGKERRKDSPSKEGFLGVEGMTQEVLISAFEKSGILVENYIEKPKEITKLHLFEAQLSGRNDSAKRRKDFLNFLELPQSLTTNAMLDILNNIFTLKQFKKAVAECQVLHGKN